MKILVPGQFLDGGGGSGVFPFLSKVILREHNNYKMGGICTKSDDAFWRHNHSKIGEYRNTFESLRIKTSDVEKLYNQFDEIDLVRPLS